MSKRVALSVLTAASGGLLLGSLRTALVGALLVAAGAYLLALPHLGRRRQTA